MRTCDDGGNRRRHALVSELSLTYDDQLFDVTSVMEFAAQRRPEDAIFKSTVRARSVARSLGRGDGLSTRGTQERCEPTPTSNRPGATVLI
jgi:hypothetical protein